MPTHFVSAENVEVFLQDLKADDSYWKVWTTKSYREYQSAYFESTQFMDQSFGIVDDDGGYCMALMASDTGENGQFRLSNWGVPVLLVCSPNFALNRLFQKEFRRRIKNSSVKVFGVFDVLHSGTVCAPIVTILSNQSDFTVSQTTRFVDVIDLHLPESILRNRLRKSYRSLVNAGERAWDVRIWSGSESKKSDFDNFQRLHREVAGRVTRSQASWDFQYGLVRQDDAIVAEARFNTELIAASLFVVHRDVWVYSVSAAKRELFDQPVNHVLVWRALLEAKKRGGRWMYMGEAATPSDQEVDSKVRSIMQFKRGFGGRTKAKLEFEIRLASDI